MNEADALTPRPRRGVHLLAGIVVGVAGSWFVVPWAQDVFSQYGFFHAGIAKASPDGKKYVSVMASGRNVRISLRDAKRPPLIISYAHDGSESSIRNSPSDITWAEDSSRVFVRYEDVIGGSACSMEFAWEGGLRWRLSSADGIPSGQERVSTQPVSSSN